MNPLVTFGARLNESSNENMTAYVRRPQRLRRMLRLDLLTFLGLIALCALEDFLVPDGTIWSIATGMTIGGAIGVAILSRIKRARSYAYGWLEGRREQVVSMTEAMGRGLTPEQWQQAEMEKDVWVQRWL